MTTVRKFAFVGVATLIAATACAQDSTSSSTIANSAAVATPAINDATSKKATRAENHRFSYAVQHAIYENRGVGDADILAFGNAATGAVVLVGYVFDSEQEQAAVDAARQVAGVTDVTSRLMMQVHGE